MSAAAVIVVVASAVTSNTFAEVEKCGEVSYRLICRVSFGYCVRVRARGAGERVTVICARVGVRFAGETQADRGNKSAADFVCVYYSKTSVYLVATTAASCLAVGVAI